MIAYKNWWIFSESKKGSQDLQVCDIDIYYTIFMWNSIIVNEFLNVSMIISGSVKVQQSCKT